MAPFSQVKSNEVAAPAAVSPPVSGPEGSTASGGVSGPEPSSRGAPLDATPGDVDATGSTPSRPPLLRMPPPDTASVPPTRSRPMTMARPTMPESPER